MTAGRSPWAWVPSLYFAQGIPYVVVMTLSVVLYKNLGISNTDIALYTSWLYLPWVIKPLWSPLAELFGTKRIWITVLQFFVGAALAGVALTIPTDKVFQLSLAVFWLMAFASASHDIEFPFGGVFEARPIRQPGIVRMSAAEPQAARELCLRDGQFNRILFGVAHGNCRDC